MSKLSDAEEIIAGLNRAEKAELLKLVVQDLADSFPGVDNAPGICGGESRIVRTRIPVWVLEQARRLGAGDGEILRIYPDLRAEDLANAWAYVRAHRAEIERDIAENEGA
jgi:uncharacterized protein (DUF433 family)